MKSKWWIGAYIQVFEPEVRKKSSDKLLVHENFILISAKDFEEAYSKILKFNDPDYPLSGWRGVKGRWRFVGVSTLLPIYERLQDGNEVLWRTLEGVTCDLLDQLVYTKSELEEGLIVPERLL